MAVRCWPQLSLRRAHSSPVATAIVTATTMHRMSYLPASFAGRAFIPASLVIRYSRKSRSIRSVVRAADDSAETGSQALGGGFALCTQQGVARMSHQPRFDCAQPSSELPADAHGPYPKLASEGPSSGASKSLSERPPTRDSWGPFSLARGGRIADELPPQ